MTNKLTTGVGGRWNVNKLYNIGSHYDAAATPQSTLTDGAVQFTASDKAYLSIADAAQTGLDPLTGDYSYSFWVNPTSLKSSVCILKTDNSYGYSCWYEADGAMWLRHWANNQLQTSSPAGTVTVGSWQQYTIVANRTGNLYVYKNGNTASPIITLNISASNGPINSTHSVDIGGYESLSYYLNGSMDSLGFWNKALSAAEVASLYNSGVGKTYSDLTTGEKTGLVSFWNFNEEGGKRYDSHGTNHLDQVFANIIDNTSTLGTELVTNGTFDSATTGWTAVNSTLASVAGGQSGNCLQVTNVGTNQGYAYQTITTTANQNYTFSYYHKNGTQPHGQVNVSGAVVGSLSVYDSGSLGDAAWTLRTVNFKASSTSVTISLFNYGSTDGATTLWDGLTLKALTQTNLNGGFESLGAGETLGSELVLNPGFETAGGGGADVFGSWFETVGTGAIADDAVTPHGGSHDALLTYVTGVSLVSQNIITTASTRYKFTFWIKGDGTNAGRYQLYDLTNSRYIVQAVTTGVTAATWTQVTKYFTTPAGCISIQLALYPPGVAGFAQFDDVSLKQVTAYSPFLNWSAVPTGLSTINVETTAPNSGTYAIRFDNDASASTNYSHQTVLTTTHKYKVSAYVKSSASATVLTGDSSAAQITWSTTTSYVLNTGYFTATNSALIFLQNSASKSIYIDDVTLICTEIPSAAGIAAGLATDGNLCAQSTAGTMYLSVNDNASIRCGTGSTDFEIGAWVNLAQITSFPTIFSKTAGASDVQTEYNIFLGTTWNFKVGDGSTAKTAGSAITVLPNVWYFVRCWINSTAQTINISVNNETTVSTSIAGFTIHSLATALELFRNWKTASYYTNGRIDGAYLIKRALTASEITALYNNGKGVKYAGLPATVSADATLSFWNLDEYSNGTSNVTRNDSKGTNHLTAVGNPPSAQGVNYYEGTVAKWLCQVSSACNMTQATQSARLLYVTNAQNGKPVLRGDGLTKCLSNANDLVGTGDVTIFSVIKPRVVGAAVYDIISNGKAMFGISGAAGVLYTSSDGVIAVYSAAASIVAGTAYVVVVTRTSAGIINFHINGVDSGTVNQASGTPAAGSPTYIGNNAAGTRGFDGDIDEVGIVSRILTTTEIDRVTLYLGVKWGITTGPTLLTDETGATLTDESGVNLWME